jgi:sialic acid synthase SpsE
VTATTIIAEFCQNHNGDFKLLTKMVESAAINGATHGKIQTIFAENLTFRPQFEQGLIMGGSTACIKRPYQLEYDRLKRLEISFQEMEKFCLLCRSVGLEPVTTCFAREHVRAIQNAGFNTVKVASYDCASYQMLRELKDTFSKIIVSTGATFDDEIELASMVLDGASYAFLHCVTIYPTPLNEMHLSRLEYLRRFTTDVGFSDHSLVSRDGLIGSKAALALGATSIERHFTMLSPEDTKDGPVSIGPTELLELADFASMPIKDRVDWMNRNVPEWSQTIGQNTRAMTDTELLNRDYYRGRFASTRLGTERGRPMIDNWEEVPVE